VKSPVGTATEGTSESLPGGESPSGTPEEGAVEILELPDEGRPFGTMSKAFA